MLAHAPPRGGSRQIGPPHPGTSRPTLGRLTPAWTVPTLGLTVRPGGCPRGGVPGPTMAVTLWTWDGLILPRDPQTGKGLTLSLAYVRAFLIPPGGPSRGRYSVLFHTATPDLHIKRKGSVVKRRSNTLIICSLELNLSAQCNMQHGSWSSREYILSRSLKNTTIAHMIHVDHPYMSPARA